MSKAYSDKGRCESDAASANRQYPACTYTCRCSGSSGSGGAVVPFDPGQQLLLQGSYMLGQALGAALMGGSRADSAAEAEERRRRIQQIEEVERLEREREQERRRRFEEDKRKLREEMKGGSASADMGFKGGDGSDTPELSFKEFHDRESERRSVLEKLAREAVSVVEKMALDWCKLHPVLYPSRSGAADDEFFKSQVEAYNVRHRAWKDYCEQDFTKVRAAALASLPEKADDNELRIRADCFGAFKIEASACSGHSNLLSYSDCINRAIQSWQKCQGSPSVPLDPSNK